SWAPVLLDYAMVNHHDSSALNYWTFDGDYVYRNFGVESKMHVVQDSDEAMLVSWAPLNDREQSLKPRRGYSNRFIAKWLKGLVLHETLTHPAHDPLKRNIFIKPVYWHAREINATWDAVENMAIRVLKTYGVYVGPQGGRAAGIFTPGGLSRVVLRLRRGVRLAPSYFRLLAEMLAYYWTDRRRVFGLAKKAFAGDPAAKKRVKQSVRNFLRRLTGRPITLD
ncbi:MAG TPA: hypothetical protein VEI95_13825, partial [Acidobacteriota bacterium]|nr:hypothetical protein [Acidobacteriota bacterium]